ncbi:MAG: hypothetical protein EOP83_26515 [Verrucomicrobiaceae bacterium]|nr:MAG: hypothetical protein EOP83_26515 [Verrucomicrobiaceae bacterium]
MKVTKVCVSAYTGQNRRPAGGWVDFEDGKTYYFGWDFHKERYTFMLSYKQECSGAWIKRLLDSPKRAAALAAFLEA